MNFKRSLSLAISIVLVVLMLSSAYALDIDASPIKKEIKQGEIAEYLVEVTNNGESTQNFLFTTMSHEWSVRSEPRTHYNSGIRLSPGQSEEFVIELTPNGHISSNIVQVLVQFRGQDSEEVFTVPFQVEIESPFGSVYEYIPVVITDAVINNNNMVDPRSNNVLVLDLDNRNMRNLTDVEVLVSSPFISEEFTTSVLPLSKKRVEFNFKVDPLEIPRVENLLVTLRFRNQTLSGYPMSIPVQVVSYSQIIRDINEDSDIFKSKVEKTIFLKNQGNVVNNDIVKIQTNYFKRVFTRTDPSPKYIWENKKQYAIWDIELAPDSSAKITLEVNYRPIFYALVLLIAGTILYFLMRSPVVVKKTAAGFNMYEGGVSEMKVLIHIRNRTQNAFNAFGVTEYIPKFASYIRSETLGSIVPSKVLKHERRGTLLKWNFEAIEPFEERIIIYKIKLNLTVLGKFNLPATGVKFKDDTNGSYTVKSNKLRITNAGTDEDSR